MLLLLLAAKSLDYETPAHSTARTQLLFRRQSAELIKGLKAPTPQQIGSLMKLSDPLAGLNVARYEAWSPKFTVTNSKQAVFAFNGDGRPQNR